MTRELYAAPFYKKTQEHNGILFLSKFHILRIKQELPLECLGLYQEGISHPLLQVGSGEDKRLHGPECDRSDDFQHTD